jgi:hypothetical protein
MASTPLADRDAALAALAQIEAATDVLAELSLDGFTLLELLSLLERRERTTCRQPTLDHRIYQRLRTECSPTTLGATSLTKAVSIRLRISAKDARTRIDDAELLGTADRVNRGTTRAEAAGGRKGTGARGDRG